jgi:hypothetical protein
MLFKTVGWVSFVMFASMLACGHETEYRSAAHNSSDASQTNLGPSSGTQGSAKRGVIEFASTAICADLLARLRKVRTEIEETTGEPAGQSVPAANAPALVKSDKRSD